MKKLLAFLILSSVLLLTGCGVFSQGEAELGFFDEGLLAEVKLTGMPAPTDEDIRHDEDTVYCNMTEEKRIEFANELASYLMTKDDIYYKGYHYETGCVGGIFFLPEYRFAPLTPDANHGGWFAFSLTEALNEGDEYNYSYWNGVTVSVSMKEGKIGSYSYNTVIKINKDPNGIAFYPTEHEHTTKWEYDEFTHWGEYTCGCETPDLAGEHVYDTDGKCTTCGFETFKTYQLSVIDEGGWLIYDRDDVYEEFDIIKFHTYVHPIKIDMYVDGEFYSSGTQVSINENVDYIEYRFVMPNRAVTVEFKTDMISYSSFLMLYPWLGQIQYRDIDEIVIEKGYVGVGPDVEPEVITHTYSGRIADIKEALIDMKICQVKPESELASPVEGGQYIKYSFKVGDDTYIIEVANNRIDVDGNVYLVYGDYPT